MSMVKIISGTAWRPSAGDDAVQLPKQQPTSRIKGTERRGSPSGRHDPQSQLLPQDIEIAVGMKQFQAMDDAVSADDHVDGLARRDAGAAQTPEIVGGGHGNMAGRMGMPPRAAKGLGTCPDHGKA